MTNRTRLVGRAVLLLLTLGAAPLLGAEPVVRFAVLERGKPITVEVRGLPAASLTQLRAAKSLDWSALLSVRVAGASSNMSGDVRVTDSVVRFQSRHAPSPGLTFHAVFDSSRVPGATEGATFRAEATLRRPPSAGTVVTAVYPSGDTLPENHLRFYLHFSNPMSRGESYAHLRLIGEDGQAVEAPFLELGEELWNAAGTRFTLLLHPGRVKRGLKPREELGPILEQGKKYTLIVDARWPDSDGNPMKATFRHSFRVGEPDETQPDPAKWKVTAPRPQSREAMEVAFPEPLDHGMLQHAIRVQDARGKPVEGKIQVAAGETRWSFTPAAPWAAGRYVLKIDPALEDRAGNSIARPFELDLVPPRPAMPARVIELTVEIK